MSRPNFVEVEATRIIDDALVVIRVEELSLLAFGVFGNVYGGRLVVPGHQKVVIKKTWCKGGKQMEEMKILRKLNREGYRNIVRLLYMFANFYGDDKRCNALVFERMQMTLSQYMKKYRSPKTKTLEVVDIKLFTWQLFNAQQHLSNHNICHRDIKPDNIFIDVNTGTLKLGDFGSSVVLDESQKIDYYQVTRYYRPPELLLQSYKYGTTVDVWSCGCVFGELLCGSILLRGNSSFQQYEVIVEMLGYPSPQDFKAMRCKPVFDEATLKNAIKIAERNKLSPCASLMPNAPPEAIKLINRILVYNPGQRLRGDALLNDSFFDDIFTPGMRRLNTRTVDVFTADDLAKMALNKSRARVV